MGTTNHVPDAANGALIDAAGVIVEPDDNENNKAANIRMPVEQLADWMKFLTGGPGNHLVANDATIGTLIGPISFSGHPKLDATPPVATASPTAGRIYQTSTSKAWGVIATNGSGGHSIKTKGLNIGSVTLTSTYIQILWALAMSGVDYVVNVNASRGGANVLAGASDPATQADANVQIYLYDLALGAAVNPLTTALTLMVDVKANQ